jgi:type II secretory pathway pseudopilin PulG
MAHERRTMNPACPNPSRAGKASPAFTAVELLTVVAIIAVIATLLSSAIAGARRRSNEVVCRNNLRQVAIAVELYHDETARRPRSLTRLTTRPSLLPSSKVLLCPADPALRERGSPLDRSSWGNRVNGCQEPLVGRVGSPEEGSWENEVREVSERVAFSYLHPLSWRREAWHRLVQGKGSQVGTVACQLHGVRSPSPGHRPFTEFEGQTLRAQRDGSVVGRKIFRVEPATPGFAAPGLPGRAYAVPISGALTVPFNDHDYPWEFYADHPPGNR